MNLTEDQLAALAAGATYEEVLAMAVADNLGTGDNPAPNADIGDDGEPDTVKAGEEQELDAEALNVQLQEATAKLTQLQEANSNLTEQLATAVEEAKQQNANLQDTINKMAAALRPYVERMATALNQAVDASSADKVLEAHSKLQPLFADAFKAGRKTVATSSATSSTKQSDYDRKMLARAKSFDL